MKAFAVTVDGFDAMVAAAENRNKATYEAWRSAQDAGYKSVTFARIRTRRFPSLDAWAARQPKQRLMSLYYAEREAAAA